MAPLSLAEVVGAPLVPRLRGGEDVHRSLALDRPLMAASAAGRRPPFVAAVTVLAWCRRVGRPTRQPRGGEGLAAASSREARGRGRSRPPGSAGPRGGGPVRRRVSGAR